MSSSSSSSQPSSQQSSPTSALELLDELSALKVHIDDLKARYDALLQQLDAAYRDHQLTDDDLQTDTHKFSRQCRKSYSFAPDHPVTIHEASLKAEKELAIALGEAEEKLTYFWTLRRVTKG
jgi:hypothetical protein